MEATTYSNNLIKYKWKITTFACLFVFFFNLADMLMNVKDSWFELFA